MNTKNLYWNKRFLITNIWLRGFGGAEINVLELAMYLISQGAKVEVYTLLLEDPLASEFKKNQITVHTPDTDSFNIESWDYIWVCQSVIPDSIITQLNRKDIKKPKFLFMHMAALPNHVLEQPYIYRLESEISSATLAISDEILNDNLNYFMDTIPNLQMYPNPFPLTYLKDEVSKIDGKIQRIIVISNHPPQEVKNLKERMMEVGVVVDYYGTWSDNYELVSPELLEKYDLVIGIGKNVQYCLALGKPIYIYDHFQGPGYLSEVNFKNAAKHNFSGRGFNQQKSVEELRDDIIKNYDRALEFHLNNKQKFIQDFGIDNVVNNILTSILDIPEKSINISSEYQKYLMAMSTFQKQYVQLNKDVSNLWEAANNYRLEISNLVMLADQLKVDNSIVNKELDEQKKLEILYKEENSSLHSELASIKNSRSFKVLQRLLSLRVVKLLISLYRKKAV